MITLPRSGAGPRLTITHLTPVHENVRLYHVADVGNGFVLDICQPEHKHFITAGYSVPDLFGTVAKDVNIEIVTALHYTGTHLIVGSVISRLIPSDAVFHSSTDRQTRWAEDVQKYGKPEIKDAVARFRCGYKDVKWERLPDGRYCRWDRGTFEQIYFEGKSE